MVLGLDLPARRGLANARPAGFGFCLRDVLVKQTGVGPRLTEDGVPAPNETKRKVQ